MKKKISLYYSIWIWNIWILRWDMWGVWLLCWLAYQYVMKLSFNRSDKIHHSIDTHVRARARANTTHGRHKNSLSIPPNTNLNDIIANMFNFRTGISFHFSTRIAYIMIQHSVCWTHIVNTCHDFEILFCSIDHVEKCGHYTFYCLSEFSLFVFYFMS